MNLHTGRVDQQPSGHTVTGSAKLRRPAHADRTALAPGRVLAGVLGAAVVLSAVGLGAAACLATLGPSTSTPPSAESITVTPTR